MKMFDLGFKCVGRLSRERMIGEVVSQSSSRISVFEGETLISPSNEVCERPSLGALVVNCYYFVAGAAPALAAAAAFALAAAAAACAGPRDANTVSRLKEAAF